MHSTGNSVFEKVPGKHSDAISEDNTNSVTNYSKTKDTAFGYGADSGLPPRAFRQNSNVRGAKKKSKLLPSLIESSPRNGHHKVQYSQDFGRNHQRKVKHNQDTILAGYDTENQDNHRFNFTYEDGFHPRGGKYETASQDVGYESSVATHYVTKTSNNNKKSHMNPSLDRNTRHIKSKSMSQGLNRANKLDHRSFI